jgi:L-xylulose reductase
MIVTKYASQSMVRLGMGGAIVNESSQAALVALDGHICYGSSKAALDNITRVSALDLGKYNIRVNSVTPRCQRQSPRTTGISLMSPSPSSSRCHSARWSTVDEIAAPIVFLLSDAASMFTGILLPIDGGYTCR